MARALRVDIAGGWYHVTARGIERRDIFRGDVDRERILDLVGRMSEQYRIRVHAYVLMTNHYHLLLETPAANVSRAMQWLNVSYSVWFNRRHGRSGHLFGGRFKSVVVEDGEWALTLSEYIHLNPLRVRGLGMGKAERKRQQAGMERTPGQVEVDQRLEALRGYRWSSYRAYAGYERGPDWLQKESILSRVGHEGEDAVAAYRRYVEERVREGVKERPWSTLKAGLVLGKGEFLAKIRAMIEGNEREQGAMKHLRPRPRFEEVVAVVEELKGKRWKEFRDLYGDWGRDVVLWAAWRWCGMSQAEIGSAAGGLDYACVSAGIRKLAQRARSDSKLARILDKVTKAMSKI